MPSEGKEPVAGIDVGNFKFTAGVAYGGSGRAVKVLGLGELPSLGIQRGVVVDEKAAAECMARVLELAGGEAGVRPKRVVVGYSGPGVEVRECRARMKLRGRKVTGQDVGHLLEEGWRDEILPGEEVLHIFPLRYWADGVPAADPIGMRASWLELEAILFVVREEYLNTYRESAERAGIEVEKVAYSPLVAAEAHLRSAEKNLGALFIDMGSGTTNVVAYNYGVPCVSGVLPVGGGHITGDLAVFLGTTLSQSEEIKLAFGLMPREMCDSFLMVPALNGVGNRQVSAKQVVEVIEARVEEIIDFIEYMIDGQDFRPRVVVLGGGGVLMKGFCEKVSHRLNTEVRLAQGPEDLPEPLRSPSLASLYGLLKYVTGSCGKHRAWFGQGLRARFGRWIQNRQKSLT